MPMQVAALALLDGSGLLDEAGELPVERIRRHVERRIRDVARLHQVLTSRGAHRRPAWTDDHRFDIAAHVKVRRLPPPGDEEALLRVCSDLHAVRLDRTRPLWEAWLLNGLADGRVALLLRLHHVVADGSAALELFSSLLDPVPDVPDEAPRSRSMDGPSIPTGDGATSLRTESGPSPVARTAGRAARGAARVGQVWGVLRQGQAPALSWNRPVDRRQVHLLVRGDLARAKAAAHESGGKVNDAVLAAVAGGAHRLLESRAELGADLDMRVSVAASVRRPGERGGNRVGVRLVAVPVGDPDALSCLRTVAGRTAAQRDRPPLQPSGRVLQRWMVHVMPHQRMINLVLSNMPGPSTPLSFAGAWVRELFQLSVVQGNCAIGVGVLSYAGQLNLDIVADADVVPDVEVFARGVTEALERLGAVRGEGSSISGRRSFRDASGP